MPAPADPPAGTVTFLLSDVEGSTRLWEEAGEVLAAASLERHAELIGAAVERHGGFRPEEQGEGDSIVAAFASAVSAAAAAVDIQRALAVEPWEEGARVRVRIGLHSGEAQLRGDRNYAGPVIHRCARLRDVAHGGQTVMSGVTAALVSGSLPSDAWLSELGTHRLRDLTQPERIVELRHRDLSAEFPPLRTLDVVPNNLPTQLTTFLGRTEEVATVRELLGRERLVCLTGSGGCGKTRLAAQVAGAESDRFPEGVWWIDLSAASRPEHVANLTAAAIGILVEPNRGALHAIAQQLRDRRLLICLDNCEHLLDAAAEVATTILAACPEASLLATSREPLGVVGEAVWRVPSMPLPDAALLFADRARHVRPGFAIDERSRDAVATICTRLDGIPLAVELAAAWARALSPVEIADGLDNRFRLLAGGPRGVVARQQTLLASIQWSHELLTAEEQAVLRRLSAFAGSFSLDAATAVCAGDPVPGDGVLELVARLVDKSLLVADDASGTTRYRQLETIRQYAADRLSDAGETLAVRDRHLHHFLDLAQQAEAQIDGRDQDGWSELLEVEHDNLRTALDWALSAADPTMGRELAAAVSRYWSTHGHHLESQRSLEQAIQAAPDERSELQVRLLSGSALATAVAGRLDLFLRRAVEVMELATSLDDDSGLAWGHLHLAYAEIYVDLEGARARAVLAEQHARAAGEPFVVDCSLAIQALTLSNQSRHEEIRSTLAELGPRCRQRGDRFSGAMAGIAQCFAALFSGDVPAARALAAEAMSLARPLGDFFVVGMCTCWLAWAEAVAGDLDGARRTMEPLLRALEGAGSDRDVPPMAFTMGRLALWAGDLDAAADWLERAAQWGDPVADNLMVCWALPDLAGLHRRLGVVEEARRHAERAAELARRLHTPHVLAEALDELAHLAALVDPSTAEDRFHEALGIRLERGLRTFYVNDLDGLAMVAARVGSSTEAVRLLAASNAARRAMGHPRPPVDESAHELLVAELRSALGEAEFESVWDEGFRLSLDDAVAYARRARGERQRPSTGWESLTPTEQEVVQLVADGLTNADGAVEAPAGRGPATSHLSHVYAKVDLTSRAELAAEVARRSLH